MYTLVYIDDDWSDSTIAKLIFRLKLRLAIDDCMVLVCWYLAALKLFKSHFICLCLHVIYQHVNVFMLLSDVLVEISSCIQIDLFLLLTFFFFRLTFASPIPLFNPLNILNRTTRLAIIFQVINLCTSVLLYPCQTYSRKLFYLCHRPTFHILGDNFLNEYNTEAECSTDFNECKNRHV